MRECVLLRLSTTETIISSEQPFAKEESKCEEEETEDCSAHAKANEAVICKIAQAYAATTHSIGHFAHLENSQQQAGNSKRLFTVTL
jgi:hypothetical protein